MRGHGHGLGVLHVELEHASAPGSPASARRRRSTGRAGDPWPGRLAALVVVAVGAQPERPRRIRGQTGDGAAAGRAAIQLAVVIQQEVAVGQRHEVDLGARHRRLEAGCERVERVLGQGRIPVGAVDLELDEPPVRRAEDRLRVDTLGVEVEAGDQTSCSHVHWG